MQTYSREMETISRGLFPPGVRFHPTDEELIVYYLKNKVDSRPLPTCLIGEIELCNYDPWELPNKALYGEDEWYFFTPRDRKYPNGVRPNRAAGSGFWKATGTDKDILNSSGSRIGVKKALVFYSGKASDGVKTEWIMTEYRLPDALRQSSRSEGSMRLDDWVLCRIRRRGNMSNNALEVQQTSSNLVEYLPKIMELPSVPTGGNTETCPNYFLPKDCSLLAALLSGQDLPGIENIPSTSENSNISKNLVADYKHVQDKGILATNSIFQDFFNPSKGKAFQANELYDIVQQPTKWITTETHNKDFISSDQPTTAAASFYDQYQSPGDIVDFLQ